MMEPMSTTDELSEPLDMNLSPKKSAFSHQKIGTKMTTSFVKMPHLLHIVVSYCLEDLFILML